MSEVRLGIDAYQDIDFRMESDGKTFRGYASVFDSESGDLGGFTETIAPGAFKRSLNQRSRDLKAYVNHDWGRLLGTRKAGTLRLKEDDYGLRAEIDLPDTADGRDVGTLTARGDIHAMSFGFVPVDVEHLDGGKVQRVREAKLLEVSPVTAWPAYSATTAGVRALAAAASAEVDEMAEAFMALQAPDGSLSVEQRDLLLRAVNARSPEPQVLVDKTPWLESLKKYYE